MTNFIAQKLNGLKRRWRCFQYGITYLRSTEFKIKPLIKVNGSFKELRFKDRDSKAFVYEFTEICINDCYQLRELGSLLGEVKEVVDIGANQGLFLLAARQVFRNAHITGYEPNYNLDGTVGVNATNLAATCYFEAVTRQDCMVALSFTDNDLETVAKVNKEGNVPGTAFSTVIERSGGTIDILKIDCEGAEWDLFEEALLWKKVRAVTMEYHLWAKPGMTTDLLKIQLEKLGFRILSMNPISATFGLLTAVRA